jgi:hypothetical protein
MEIDINTNDIVFEEDKHNYTRNGANYISVTTLLKKYNLSAHYSTQIPSKIMQQAATRGATVHKTLENYIKFNTIDPNSEELKTFSSYITNRGIDLTTAISEEIVYNDTYLIAGTIDFQYNDNGESIIADFKTTSSIHWESVAWQLSIYNFIKCKGNVLEYYMKKLMVYHMRASKLNIREVPMIEYDEVVKLLTANLNNAPYTYKPDFSKIISNSEGVVLQQLVTEIEQYKTILEELTKKKEALQSKIIANMVANNQPSCDINNIHITYTPPTSRETVDKKKLKQYCDNNFINMDQFITISTVKEKLTISIRDDNTLPKPYLKKKG